MELIMRYQTPAPDSEEGWEKYSMPIGNSYMGGNVFGGVEHERIQITENSLENPGKLGGLNSFADIYIHFPHTEQGVEHYERGLNIGKALSYVHYNCGNVHVEREYFMSYPDRALVGRITTSEQISYKIEIQIPHLTEEEGREKRGFVTAAEHAIIMSGVMCAYNVRFEGQLRVFTDGIVAACDGILNIDGATDTYFIFCGATNYELRPEVFTEQDNHKKLRDFDPHDMVCGIMERATEHTFETLKLRHLEDYYALFGRVTLELGETEVPEEMTDELLALYSQGERSHYLEVLYFQYGRHLLIASSRSGCLPANLQGV